MRIDPAHVYRATLTSADRSLRRDLFVADARPTTATPVAPAAASEAPAQPSPAVIEPDVTPSPVAPSVALSESRDLITLAPIALRPEDAPAAAEAGRGSGLPRYGYDVRAMSPRQMANLSLDLYVDGVLSWNEYSMLAFQPELHPDYDQTIGALTGEPAEPDKPRNFVELWQDRLGFERRYSAHNPEAIQRTERIVQVLSMIDTPTRLVA